MSIKPPKVLPRNHFGSLTRAGEYTMAVRDRLRDLSAAAATLGNTALAHELATLAELSGKAAAEIGYELYM